LSASRFQIHELQVDGQGVASFTATFEQSCLSYKPALRGCIHYAR
jgi:hypothetical protein